MSGVSKQKYFNPTKKWFSLLYGSHPFFYVSPLMRGKFESLLISPFNMYSTSFYKLNLQMPDRAGSVT